jgi:hypothetical protein
MKWLYDACGEYCNYKGYVIIKQDHPKLMKYALYREKYNKSLVFEGTACTLESIKDLVNEIILKS